MINKIARNFLCIVFLLVLYGCESYLVDETKLAIHEAVLTIDTHVDTPLILYNDPDFDLGAWHDPYETNTKLDFPRMREGGLDAVFFANWIPQGPRTPAGNEQAKQRVMDTAELIYLALQANSDVAELALGPKAAFQLEQEGKRAIFIGMENGYPIGNDLSLIQTYYDLGVRYITLCHSRNNDICDSSTDPSGPEHGGLSPFGEQVVQEMNRVGIMIDVSHISDEAFYDVVELSTTPVIASHSNARALYNHPRNLDDAMLRKLSETGGVIQVIFLYVTSRDNSDPNWLPTVADLVDHIDHIVDVAGIDHVGIGTDFDGGGQLDDCYDVTELPNITQELLARGYRAPDIRKIWGSNLIRVMRKVYENSNP